MIIIGTIESSSLPLPRNKLMINSIMETYVDFKKATVQHSPNTNKMSNAN